MWKLLLAFGAHRLLLVLIALLAVNISIHARDPRVHSFLRIEPTHVLLNALQEQLHRVGEIEIVEKLAQIPAIHVFSENRHPFYWVVRWWMELTSMRAVPSTLLVSNALFLFFIFETFVLLSRMVLLETALWGCLLILVFPSSYELSLGSSLSLSLCLSAVILRRALDNQWFFVGGAFGILALGDWMAIGLLPLMVGLFWFFQRHFQMVQVIKRAAFFLVPLSLAILYRWDWYRYAAASVMGSALLSLAYSPAQWVLGLNTLQFSSAGPIVALAFFLVGSILSLASHTTWLNRLLPSYLMVVVLAFSSLVTVPVRLLYAGIALTGIAHISSGMLAKIFAFVFTALSVAEIFRLFSVA